MTAVGRPLISSAAKLGPDKTPQLLKSLFELGNSSLITSNGRFAKDSYRRFIQMYSNVVLGVEAHLFEELIDNYKLTY